MEFWSNLSRAARVSLIAGIVVIVTALAVASWWALRVEYQVLFSDLKAQDTQAMTAELDRLKIPYKLGDSGTAILVDANTVHATRIKLMGKDLPLHGAVGFELFNNTDFGMTEFAQKINFQRALQGELTRTILSLEEVKDARVHLAMPESGLFKQANARAKASINLTLRQGASLRTEQISGIQRLVAAAVPGMTTQDVTLVDNRGVALSRSAGTDGETDAGGQRLDLKRDTETYLNRKATAVLENIFGPGQALASVDVTLNMDQMRVTTEDVISTPNKAGTVPTGVLIRERETMREPTPPLDARADASSRASSSAGTQQREADYAVGRRVEQVIGQPGSIRRIQVVAVVRKALTQAQEEQVQRLISAAVGANFERGDGVVVQTMQALVSPNAVAATADPASPGVDSHLTPIDKPQTSGTDAAHAVADETTGAPTAMNARTAMQAGTFILVILVSVIGATLVLRKRTEPAAGNLPTNLSPEERAQALQRIQQWMASDNVTTADQSTGMGGGR